MPSPSFPPGACLDCITDYANCQRHRAEDRERDARRTENIRSLLTAQHERTLDSICLRYELESDEGGTRHEKAARILRNPSSLKLGF